MSQQLRWAWYGTDLGGTRPCASTYEMYETAVPEIPPEKTADLRFLPPPKPLVLDSTTQYAQYRVQEQARTQALLERIQTTHALPPTFVRLLSSNDLQNTVPSSTAAYFYLGEPVQVPALGAHILLFYRDQQDCVLWYLVLDGPYAGNVLASHALLKSPTTIAADNGMDDASDVWDGFLDESVLCAASFEEFVYRIWIENHIWYSEYCASEDDDSVETTPAIQAECQWYLEACKGISA
ncbi:hypothetical protein ACHHYP_11452 [Achlya hypogyna]|uniref:Uncharacterized protein n=1 Tax=Achlya hypogyna TaxID=1202772 RepID=A0A1V9YJ60_ACHHY|nr:hypothetical protein ACHHYP_11452 [Achlya hypogyna]